jgi:hypothetical protein
MRLSPPRVPPAASAAFGAAYGPRVLPGTYTVKMTKDTATYSTQLAVVPDPRATHTDQERRAALDLALKTSGTLTDMTFAVERMNAVRQALDDRAGKLPAGDAVAKRLRAASAAVDVMRKKIVATKEGGMITGEERLRENLADLYSSIIFYDGGPSQTQIERADAIARELGDVTRDFDAWMTRDLAGINSALRGKKLEPIAVMNRQQWEAAGAAGR